MTLRFNHMELTVPKGTLIKEKENLSSFYGEVFGFEVIEVPMVDERIQETKLLMRTDPETSQFMFIVEQDADRCIQSPGYDHLGFLLENSREVDDTLARCKEWQQKDARLEIKVYDDLDTPQALNRTFYVRYILPIWFDIHSIEFHAGFEPKRKWVFE
ncbi:MAG: VOC family protein [Pseudomonadales bacterium]|nr:VOC family protein [Pseudomonadales bacterium]